MSVELLLFEEVLDVYKHRKDEIRNGEDLMQALNASHRVLDRGHEVRSGHLAMAIVAKGLWQQDHSTDRTQYFPSIYGSMLLRQAN